MVSLRGWLTVKNVGLSLEFKINASVQVKGGPKILPKSQEKLEIHVHNMEKYSQLLPCRHPAFTYVMFSGKQTTARKMVDQLKNC